MKKFLNNILKNRGLRTRLILFFLILIYFPIIINIYFIYEGTINAVKKDKIEVSKKVLIKTREVLESELNKVAGEVNGFATNLAIGASIAKYDTSIYKKRIDAYIKSKIRKIVDSNEYINDATCITIDGKVLSAKNKLNIDGDKFFIDKLYNEILINNKEQLWIDINIDRLSKGGKQDDKVLLVQKIHHITPKDSDEGKLMGTGNDVDNGVVGFIFVDIDKEELISLYSTIALTDDNDISIYNEFFKPIISKPYIKLKSNFITIHNRDNLELFVKEVNIKGTDYLLGVSDMKSPEWNIVSLVPIDSLIEPTKEGIKGSFKIVGIISVIVAIIITLEVLVLSRLVTEKEMVNYRLNVSENLNQKLRIYKHDFMNHLQIIQALLEMGHSERAMEYLKNIANEGRAIHNNYEIGIPELEATISTAINEAKKQNIEVELDTIEITEELPIDLYDLIKIITNLIKNAMYALTNSDSDMKILKIEISYELGYYIFKITNNVPIIPEDIREKIFNKGFSTKGDNGNGLGLFIIKRLVDKYGGDLKLVVDENGNNFIVSIPEKY
ncbi:ATP-binding protein [Dethiothermospora halolimnae]|uniref:ATP-binding protein n=1 Tax=Dethiothermospora halolimnae TaxID=3114390 RepID=UPI003CCC0882